MLVLVIGVGLGWTARTIRNALIRNDAVAAVNGAGGWIAFGPPLTVGFPPSSTTTDEVIARVGRSLDELRILHIDNSTLSDSALEHLGGLTSLDSIHVSHTQITDAGMAHLKGLTDLSDLDLSGTRVSDGGLVNLSGLVRLCWLSLESTNVTDAGLCI